MTRFFTAILLLFIISACQSNRSMKLVDPYVFLNDNSSKVWLVSKLMKGENDYSPLLFRNKQMIIFHESRNAFFYRISDFGKAGGVKAYYWMNRDKDEFGFEFGKKIWLFEIEVISRTRLILKPKYDSYPYKIVLVPFPEY